MFIDVVVLLLRRCQKLKCVKLDLTTTDDLTLAAKVRDMLDKELYQRLANGKRLCRSFEMPVIRKTNEAQVY